MNRIRGFLSAELIGYGVVALVVLGLVAGGVFYVRHVGTTEHAAGKKEGIAEEKGRWLARDNEELVAANQRIHDLEEEKRALERKSVDDVQAAAVKLDQTIKEKDDEKKRALADRAAGTAFGLRWSPSPPAAQAAGGSTGAAPGADTAGSEPAASCELPGEVTDSLIELASEADKVVAERNTLLEIAQKDREVCK